MNRMKMGFTNRLKLCLVKCDFSAFYRGVEAVIYILSWLMVYTIINTPDMTHYTCLLKVLYKHS